MALAELPSSSLNLENINYSRYDSGVIKLFELNLPYVPCYQVS